MPFDIVRNDITNMQVDAVVNAASCLPRVNAGVDSAIHKKAGPSLLEARKKAPMVIHFAISYFDIFRALSCEFPSEMSTTLQSIN